MTEASKRADCRMMLTEISAYLDGELDPTVCDAIDRHCRECVRCASLVNDLRDTVGLCRQAASLPLPESVLQRARASVQRLLDETSSSSTAQDEYD
jgi:anti-sigma factor RsiW